MSEAQPQKTVLVVDDDSDLRLIVTEWLTDEGYEVLTAENGADALNVLAVSTPDVILLDLMMPVMSGVEFIAALEKKGAPQPPIIISTATPQHAPKGIRLLKKPFEIDKLTQQLDDVLSQA